MKMLLVNQNLTSVAGNKNNFQTEKECQNKCKTQNNETKNGTTGFQEVFDITTNKNHPTEKFFPVTEKSNDLQVRLSQIRIEVYLKPIKKLVPVKTFEFATLF